MKNIIAKISSLANLSACLLAASLALNSSVVIAKEVEAFRVAEPKIVSLTNPVTSFGVHIGDKLSRKVVLEAPTPYQIAESAFPKKGTKDKGIELVEINVETDQQKSKTIYTVNLSYQVFINANTPTVMQLPAEKFTLTGGEKAAVIELPAWGFWFSPFTS